MITNMTMNYDEATWGTSFVNRDRAPKMVTITMGFAPIHDLPLGLDYRGDMIAPVYPVGMSITETDPYRTDDNPQTVETATAAARASIEDRYPGRPLVELMGGEES